MDWPAVSDPKNPGYQRMWEDIQATRDHRAVIEGHGSGLWDLDRINAFAGSGISSDHEARIAQEAWDKMQRGVFMQLRDTVADKAIPLFVKNGLKDWSNVSLVTDDRNVYDTLKTGTMNYHVKMAIQFGAPVEAAYAMASYYPARHAHVDPLVGSIAPGRYADVVLLTSVKDVAIKDVFSNGKLAALDGKYILPVPKIDWPKWATDTINIKRKLTAKDFEILAPAGRTTVEAAIQTPRYTSPEQKYVTLPVVDGVVQRDIEHDIIKVADIDRYFGDAAMGKMFWSGLGPKTPDSALATSVSHDLHEIAVFGTSDEAMAVAVNKLVELDGGIVLVNHGQVVASMRLEIGGLMTCRPIADAAANLEKLYSAADAMEWIGNARLPARVNRRPDHVQSLHVAARDPIPRQSHRPRLDPDRRDNADDQVALRGGAGRHRPVNTVPTRATTGSWPRGDTGTRERPRLLESRPRPGAPRPCGRSTPSRGRASRPSPRRSPPCPPPRACRWRCWSRRTDIQPGRGSPRR